MVIYGVHFFNFLKIYLFILRVSGLAVCHSVGMEIRGQPAGIVSSLGVGPRDQTQVLNLSNNPSSPLSHLNSL